ncbi:MAG: hypothetical protein HYZ62_00325 [Candidatus Andersenbacteria bacterium]|nr:hypothetical protein [Candidatus Andersenbacteria bacterium]
MPKIQISLEALMQRDLLEYDVLYAMAFNNYRGPLQRITIKNGEVLVTVEWWAQFMPTHNRWMYQHESERVPYTLRIPELYVSPVEHAGAYVELAIAAEWWLFLVPPEASKLTMDELIISPE